MLGPDRDLWMAAVQPPPHLGLTGTRVSQPSSTRVFNSYTACSTYNMGVLRGCVRPVDMRSGCDWGMERDVLRVPKHRCQVC